MAKKTKGMDIALTNLDGFMTKGARDKSRINIPTGHFDLDFALHYGEKPSSIDLSTLKGYDPKVPLGLPCGRLVELYGEEGSGKSSLAYRVCGMAQKMGHKALWIDLEHSFEENLAELNGCNVDELLYSEAYDKAKPDKIYYAEDIMDKIVAACKGSKDHGIKVIVLDSVANLVPHAVGEGSANDDTMALLARILSKTLGKVAQHAAINDVLVIFINQIREKPGVMFGNPQTTPGGRALKFNASVRLMMTKRTSKEQVIFTDEEDVNGDIRKVIVGRNSGLVIAKNRCAKPLLDETGGSFTLDLPVYFKEHFPEIEEVAFNMARQIKLVSVRTGVYTWKSSNEEIGDIKITGQSAFIKNLMVNSLLVEFIKEIKERAIENGVLLPPEMLKVDMKDVEKLMKKTAKELLKNSEKEEPVSNKDALEDVFEEETIVEERTKKSTKRGRKKATS